MRVLLVDDEPLARDELRYLLSECEEIGEITDVGNIQDALGEILIKKFDLIFLDIHLTNENGLSLAEQLNKMKERPLIIFATAYDDYGAKAFELEAQDYLLKPFGKERVVEVVQRAYKQVAMNENIASETDLLGQDRTTLPVKVDERIFLVKMKDIIVINVDTGKLTLSTMTEKYQSNDTLSGIEKKLPCDSFLRVHRSYIINLYAVKEIQPWFNQTYQVSMTNGMKVPISRSYMKQFRNMIGLEE